MSNGLAMFIVTAAFIGLLVIIVGTLRSERKWVEKNKIIAAEVECILTQMYTVFKDTFAGTNDMKAALSAVILLVFELRQDKAVSAEAIDRAVNKFGKDIKALS